MSSLENYNHACRAILTGLGKPEIFDETTVGCFKGVTEGRQYAEIAKTLKVSEGTIKARSSQLWAALSEYFQQKVSRYNVHELLDGYLRGDYETAVANPHIDADSWPLEVVLQPQKFVGRQQELEEFEKLVNHNGIGLLIGAAGIGKSALVAQYIHSKQYRANTVIWQGIEPGCSLKNISNAMGLTVEESTDYAHINAIVEALQRKQYVLVLDQAEALIKQEAHERLSLSAYAKEYSSYEGLIKAITKRNIKSHVIIISRVPFRDLERARSNGVAINILQIGGLTPKDVKVFMNLHRIESSQYQKLCDLYEGNPGCLKDALSQIVDLYGGNVEEFLRATLYLSRNFRNLYQPQLDELSDAEISVLKLLQTPLKFIELEEAVRKAEINISRGNLIQILEMLQMSQLVEAEVEQEKREKRFVANGIAIQCIK
jgi:hypothetical protein